MYMIITEIPNDLPNMNPIRERMDVYIPDINHNLPRRNGFVYMLLLVLVEVENQVEC